MSARAITTSSAPAPVGPYNQAVLAGGWLYCSGQIPIDPATGSMVGNGDVTAETRQVLNNLIAVLKEAGASPSQVVRCTVYSCVHAPWSSASSERVRTVQWYAVSVSPGGALTAARRMVVEDMRRG